ncbi:MAG: hypothetical protein IPO43_15640 [Rhodoferax sp.]|nr:hypothetical protein [Rhodoferax sp.]
MLSITIEDSGASITALCPGITATQMFSHTTQANQQLGKLPDFLNGDVNELARQTS